MESIENANSLFREFGNRSLEYLKGFGRLITRHKYSSWIPQDYREKEVEQFHQLGELHKGRVETDKRTDEFLKDLEEDFRKYPPPNK